MSDVTSVTISQAAPLPAERPRDLLEVIAQAALDPRIDAEKMRALFELQRDIQRENAKIEFKAALNRVQAKIPPIEKDGRIIVRGEERSRYSKYETIDEALRPIYSPEGFALSFDTESQDGKLYKVTCVLSHSLGHSEPKSLMVPLDSNQFRSDVQSVGSSLSYAKRQLVKMHFNIIEKGEDDDGNGGNGLISAEDVQNLETMIYDTKSNLDQFLKYMDVKQLADIPKKRLPKAFTALETKRRGRQ